MTAAVNKNEETWRLFAIEAGIDEKNVGDYMGVVTPQRHPHRGQATIHELFTDGCSIVKIQHCSLEKGVCGDNDGR